MPRPLALPLALPLAVLAAACGSSSRAPDGGVPDGGAPDAADADAGAPDAPPPDAGPRCGDGALDDGEACDDGNTASTDACLSTCEPPAPRVRTVGPLLLQPGAHRPVLTLYLVSPGGPLQGALAVDPIGAPGGAGAGRSYDPYPGADHLAVVRVLDPDEEIVHWHYQRQRPGGAAPEVIASPAEPPPPIGFDAHGNLQGYRFSLQRPGVYQVRLATNSLKTAVRLDLPDGVGVGVAYHNGAFAWPFCLDTCGDAPATTMFAWAPRHPTAPLWLELAPARDGSPLPTLLDEAGAALPVIDRGAARRYVVAPGAEDDGAPWRVELPAVAQGDTAQFVATGFPLILADSAEAARAIRGSVVRLADGPRAGTLVHHRFQAEALALIDELLADDLAGDAAARDALDGPAYRAAPTAAACAAPAAADDVWRNLDLLDGYDSPLRATRFYLARAAAAGAAVTLGAGDRVLHDQPGHHWAGAIGLPYLDRQRCGHASDCVAGGGCDVAAGRCEVAFDPASPASRWDVLRGLRFSTRDGAATHPSFTGLALASAAARHLALAATLSSACNPWGPATPGAPPAHPALVALAAAAGLAELLVITEDDRFAPVGDDDPYPGSMLFPLAQATGGLALLAPHLEAALAAHPGLAARVQATWARGLRHVVDRLLAAYLTTTMNQSSHLLVAVEELAHGLAGLPQAPLYRALARASAARFVEAIQPAGWFEEASGPSPSYAGMQHWHLARYLQLTAADPEGEDAAVRGALAAGYAFFGATVAVEPDGQRTGGFDFTHRIGTGFEEEQWRGARGMAEGIPEVAAWTAWAFPAAGLAVEAARASLASFAASFGGSVAAVPRSSLLGQASVATSLDSAARVTPAALPFQRPGSFVQPYGAPGAPQLVTVRRELPGGDAWYAAVYVGATAPSYAYSAHYAETRAVPVTNHGVVVEDVPARDDPSTGAATAHSIDVYASSPMLSGGLSLLGSTRFGSAVVGASWSPLTHHGLVAELVAVDGARSRRWARYPTVTLDPALPGADGACARALADQPRLTSSPTTPGEAPGVTTFAELDGDLGLCAARHLRFDDAGVHVRVVVRRIAAGTASPARLFENVPMPTCTRDGCAAAGPTGSAASQRNRKAAGATLAAAPWGFALRDSAGHGLDLVLETPTPGSAHPEGMRHAYYGDELQLGRVELELAAPAAIGDEVEVAYRLLPVSAP